jgi:ABC-type Fe3+-citrate transport system substrate-binding protein
MARERTVILDADEDIISYEHHIYGRFIRILVGFGVRDTDGKFTPSENQNYEQIIITGPEYDDFMSAKGDKPANQFRKEDLWQPVDFMRDDVIAKRDAVLQEEPIKLAKK